MIFKSRMIFQKQMFSKLRNIVSQKYLNVRRDYKYEIRVKKKKKNNKPVQI